MAQAGKGHVVTMSDTDAPRRPGPWDPKPEEAAAAPPAPAAPERRARAVEPPLDKGQNPVWAVISTLLLGGFIWWVTGSWVIAVALIWGLLVHEYGHVLAMNRLGMGPARIYIIPFLGGVAKSQRLPQSEWHGVLVSLAGPACGLLAAIPFLAGFIVTGKHVRGMNASCDVISSKQKADVLTVLLGCETEIIFETMSVSVRFKPDGDLVRFDPDFPEVETSYHRCDK